MSIGCWKISVLLLSHTFLLVLPMVIHREPASPSPYSLFTPKKRFKIECLNKNFVIVKGTWLLIFLKIFLSLQEHVPCCSRHFLNQFRKFSFLRVFMRYEKKPLWMLLLRAPIERRVPKTLCQGFIQLNHPIWHL